MNYIFHYDIAALIITLVIALHFANKKNIDTYQNRAFSLLIIFELISVVLDLITMYTIEYPNTISKTWHYLLNEVYLITFNATACVYFVYITKTIKRKVNHKLRCAEKILIVVPMATDTLLTLTTPLTGLIFTIAENNEYKHGELFFILYANAMFYIITSQVYSMIYNRVFTKSQMISVYTYTITSFLVLIAQMLFPQLMIAQFAVSIAIVMIYLSLENPLDYTEKNFGTYNKTAFEKIISKYIENKKHFSVFAIKINGVEYLSETMGIENATNILRQCAEFLTVIASNKKVFYLSDNKFAIISENKKELWEELAILIYNRFKKSFKIDLVTIPLNVSVCVINYPNDANRLENVEALINLCLTNATKKDEIIYADKNILEKHIRENKIIHIMKKALKNNSFSVFYQPIYSVKNKKYSSAEALIRLKDDELGFISPEEFIPLAEKNGLILEIGEFVFKEVCKFISTKKLLSKGIEYIEVNLSVVQCMQETLYKDLIRIMDDYNLPHSCINLEITETAAVMSYETLTKNMNKLIECGVNFSLDDYGTGFSNTSFVTSYPFKIVKIDKSMVWTAMEDEKAMYALKYTMAMIKAMGMELVAEGVENEEHIKLLTKLGCDFFQGYYYSKPINEESFLEKISI